jgi:hypothetical protein
VFQTEQAAIVSQPARQLPPAVFKDLADELRDPERTTSGFVAQWIDPHSAQYAETPCLR